MRVKQFLRDVIEDRGIGHQEIADYMDVTRAQVTMWLSTRRHERIPASRLKQFCAYLAIPLSAALEHEDIDTLAKYGHEYVESEKLARVIRSLVGGSERKEE